MGAVAEGEGARPGAPVDADQHEQPSTSVGQLGQVQGGRVDALTCAAVDQEGARLGAPVNADQHEQPSRSAGQLG